MIEEILQAAMPESFSDERKKEILSNYRTRKKVGTLAWMLSLDDEDLRSFVSRGLTPHCEEVLELASDFTHGTWDEELAAAMLIFCQEFGGVKISDLQSLLVDVANYEKD